MNKKLIILFCLSFSIASVNAAFIDTLFVYMKNCTQRFSSFFVVTRAKQLAQPQAMQSAVESLSYNSTNHFLGKGCVSHKKKLQEQRNQFDTNALIKNQNQYFDQKICGTLDQTIGGSIVIPIDYDKVDTHFELLACGKGDKFRGERFINKKFDSSILETFDASKEFYKTGIYRPSAEAV